MAKQPKKPKKFDALAVLRKIAADDEVAAHARVGACKALLQHERDNDGDENEPGKDAPPSDAITRRALKLLQGGKS